VGDQPPIFQGMVAREQHHADERRLLPPRRASIERRIGERRLELLQLPDERREQAERRHGADRRERAGRRHADVARPPRSRFVVLVVSDRDGDVRQVRELLHGAGPEHFDVTAVAPQASPDRLARGGVDVVLLALSLSARRGFTTFSELRALAPTVPFLFLSDAKDARHGLEAVRAGAQDFLVMAELDGDGLSRAVRHAIERNRLHTALLDMALVDDLTGLYNRRGFLTLATRDLRLARRGDETLLVAFADLDDLKRVNDTSGHAVGDRALRDTAGVLRQTFRDSDLVARLGGDEYAVLVRHARPETAGVLGDRLKRHVREFNRRAVRPYQLSISLGFAFHKAGTLDSVTGLLDRADRALYRDKRRKHEEG
jgi:diguanylate cyclase (GGDEF)-like protein